MAYFRLYFTKVNLGTPPREFYVQIDTGSDVLWVSCASCIGCPQTSGLQVNPLLLSLLIQWYKPRTVRSTYLWELWIFIHYYWILLQIQLNYFDPRSSSTSSFIACSDQRCKNGVQSSDSSCSGRNNQCTYIFQYGDGSGTSGYYVSDFMHFASITEESLLSNSSAPVVFGWVCNNWN